jgi:hypothetical protein
MRKEKVCFLEHNTLVLQVSGQFDLETSSGGMLLIGKNQLGEITKTPMPGEGYYETIVISLQEDLLRKIALEERIEIKQKYTGPPNILIPRNDFLHGYFQSVIPYVRNPAEKLTDDMGMLKVKEAVKLVLHAMPELSGFLFDFSEPYKIIISMCRLKNLHSSPEEALQGLSATSKTRLRCRPGSGYRKNG